jgi:transposase
VKTQKRIGGVLLSILTEQLFPAKGWRVAATTHETKHVAVDLVPMRASAICSGCGETKLRIHDVKPTRTWRHTDCWNLPTLVRAAPRRVRCRHCGIRIEQVPWARTRSRFTHDFEAEVPYPVHEPRSSSRWRVMAP